MKSQLVCTANRERRQWCDAGCGSCHFLKEDRRRSGNLLADWAASERRLISNILPAEANVLELAGHGGVISAGGAGSSFPSILVVLVLVFNVLDVILTARALSLGVAEGNPVMAGLFHVSIPFGLVIKFLAVSAGALILWRYRHRPLAAHGMNILTACYGAVVVYHVVFQLGTL